MNKLIIIGNLTRDPELRTTQTGVNVCSFTLAVNRRNKDGKDEADFFRVTAWRGLADNCAKYLSKGRKVAVVGSVSLHKYTNQKGENGASMEVTADDIEFMPSANQQKPEIDQKSGMEQVHPDDLPY